MQGLGHFRRAVVGAPQLPLRRGAKGWGWYLKHKQQGADAFQRHKQLEPFDWAAYAREKKASRAFFDLTMDDQQVGRVVFQLADDLCPKTVENFLRLCKGEGPRQLGYKGTIIHHINAEAHVMGGDVEMQSGKGGHSSFDTKFFKDESFAIPHAEEGILSMASVGVDTNSSQFYVTLKAAPHLNGRCVAFGRVEQGKDVLQQVSKVFTMRGRPAQKIEIQNCGVLES